MRWLRCARGAGTRAMREVSRVLLFVLGAAVTTATGCSVADDARLLQLRGVEAGDVVLGESLRVLGSGFPTGAACRVVLRGRLFEPGRSARTIDVALSAQATSDEEIVAMVRETSLPMKSRHATFVGDVVVRFDARLPGSATYSVSGVSGVSGTVRDASFDLVRAEVNVAERYAQLRIAQHTLSALGIVLEEDQANDDGLRVGWATEQSVAARAGLRQGDVLTHLDGLRLRTVADFVAPPGTSRLRVGVKHSDRPRQDVVELRLPIAGESGLDYTGLTGALAAVLALMAVAWLAPVPHRLVWFSGARAAGGRARGAFDAAFAAPERPAWFAGVWLLAAALVWVGMAVLSRWQLSLHLSVVAALVAALHLVLTGTNGRGRARVLSVGRELVTLTLVLAPLACAGLVAGSLTLDGVADRQGALPWQWFAFKAPPLLLASAVFLSATRRLVARVAEVHAAPALALAIVLSGVGVAAFFGGWQVMDHGGHAVLRAPVFGIVAFAAKAWLVLLFATTSSPRVPARLTVRLWVPAALASVLLSAVWMRIGLLPSIELLVGATLFVASLLVALVVAWRAQRSGLMPAQ